jgi:hypothetical protein
MKAIWKYELDLLHLNCFEMPIGAEILSVQTQHGHPCIWTVVEKENKLETRVFEIVGTGHGMINDRGIMRNFIGTFQMNGGDLIFHLFEKVNMVNT